MAERDFEAELERLFNQPPAMADNDAFAARVTRKLEKGWRLRAVGIAAAGAVGGLIALSQTIGSGLGLRIFNDAAQSDRQLDAAYGQAANQLVDFSGVDLSSIGLSANLFAMVAVAGVLAVAAMGVRLIDEA
jgi:hypothetical protein